MRPATILIVEDEPLILTMMEDEFLDQGFVVICAMRAKEALAVIESDAVVDLLFTDVRLPGAMSGFALAAKAIELRPDLPVLYATGYSDQAPPDIHLARFFLKPYSVMLWCPRPKGLPSRSDLRASGQSAGPASGRFLP